MIFGGGEKKRKEKKVHRRSTGPLTPTRTTPHEEDTVMLPTTRQNSIF